MQRAQRLQTETKFINTHALDRQTDVMQTAAESLGKLGGSIDGSGNGGFNPAGMMAGMMMGGAIGNQMAGYMSQMGNNVQSQAQNTLNTPPPIAIPLLYYVYLNDSQSGPFVESQLRQMANLGQITPETYVWKQGLPQWTMAKDTELSSLFNTTTPPPFPPQPPK